MKNKISKFSTILCLYIFTFLFFLSCGKESKTSDNESISDSTNNPSKDPNKNPRSGSNIPIEESFIQLQRLYCADEVCPSFLVKLVVIGESAINYCTGVILANGVIATHHSCLPQIYQAPNLNCEQKIYAFTNTTGPDAEKPAILNCKTVIDVKTSNNPVFSAWSHAYTLMQFEIPAEIATSSFHELAIDTGAKEFWQIENINDKEARLKKKVLELLGKNYALPFNPREKSTMHVVSSIDPLATEEGGVLLNKDNQVEGVFVNQVNEQFIDYLNKSGYPGEKLNHYYLFSELYCSQYPQEQVCLSQIKIELLDQLRQTYLTQFDIHLENWNKIKASWADKKKYFWWDVTLIQDVLKKPLWEVFQAKPLCIYKIKDWIDRFKTSRGKIYTTGVYVFDQEYFQLETKLNAKLQVFSLLRSMGYQRYQAEFNPFLAYKKNKTPVKMSGLSFGQTLEVQFEDITDQCPVEETPKDS